MRNSIYLLILTMVLFGVGIYLVTTGLNGRKVVNTLGIPSPTVVSVSLDSTTLPDVENLESSVSAKFKEEGEVRKIIDGDTIEVEVDGEVKKVRYIGVNTPETVDPRRGVECFGKEASLENKRLLNGKTVYLNKDISETDKYDRLLRYVYLKLEDQSYLFVNDYLVREGFAQVSTYPPDVKFTKQFEEAQKEAMEGKKGLWRRCK